MESFPKDPVMLLSFVNMKLRDFYPSLEELCHSLNISPADLEGRLSVIDYRYDAVSNRFV